MTAWCDAAKRAAGIVEPVILKKRDVKQHYDRNEPTRVERNIQTRVDTVIDKQALQIER